MHTAYCSEDGEAWLTASTALSGHNAVFVSVDLIGEKNQLILEFKFSLI